MKQIEEASMGEGRRTFNECCYVQAFVTLYTLFYDYIVMAILAGANQSSPFHRWKNVDY